MNWTAPNHVGTVSAAGGTLPAGLSRVTAAAGVLSGTPSDGGDLQLHGPGDRKAARRRRRLPDDQRGRCCRPDDGYARRGPDLVGDGRRSVHPAERDVHSYEHGRFSDELDGDKGGVVGDLVGDRQYVSGGRPRGQRLRPVGGTRQQPSQHLQDRERGRYAGGGRDRDGDGVDQLRRGQPGGRQLHRQHNLYQHHQRVRERDAAGEPDGQRGGGAHDLHGLVACRGGEYGLQPDAGGHRGDDPVQLVRVSGDAPRGPELVATGGVLSGTPTTAESSNFTVRVAGANNASSTKDFSVTINAAAPPTPITLSIRLRRW